MKFQQAREIVMISMLYKTSRDHLGFNYFSSWINLELFLNASCENSV